MTILATMPGKFGDILWALPTVRLLAGRHKTKVDFMTSPAYSSILELVQHQGYILETWTAEDWTIRETAPMTPQAPPECGICGEYEKVYHLGYKEWPAQSLANEIRDSVGFLEDPPLRLKRPWIQADDVCHENTVIAVGISDEHIELKMGVLLGLIAQMPEEITWKLLLPPKGMSHRAWEWVEVAGYPVEFHETTWIEAAGMIAAADLFFGCLSALWVLANAVGTPTVIMEPSVERHNEIFWRTTPKNHMVLGNTGKPTWDLRATRDLIVKVLKEGRDG